MEISMQPEEMALVGRILRDYLSDLRMEIADTEDYDLRQDLKHDEVMIKVLIERFEQPRAAAA